MVADRRGVVKDGGTEWNVCIGAQGAGRKGRLINIGFRLHGDIFAGFAVIGKTCWTKGGEVLEEIVRRTWELNRFILDVCGGVCREDCQYRRSGGCHNPENPGGIVETKEERPTAPAA